MMLATVKSGPTRIAFDVVAVHGLGGDLWKTWTDRKSRICWIKDLLPEDCSEARIMTFGYDSAITVESLVQSIQSIAKQLVFQLDTARADCPSRPLVFVTHSLGGIIVKDALALAKDDKTCNKTIFSGTKGILFFGTPHRGTEIADLGNRVAFVANFCLARPHNQLVRGLQEGSEILDRISQQFKGNHSKWELVSFTEQVPTPGINRLVVEEWSARLDYHNEFHLPVQETHSNICKVKSKEEGLYPVIIRQIKRVAFTENDDEVGVTVFPLGRRIHTHYIDRPALNSQIDDVNKRSPEKERGPPKTCMIHGIGGSGKSQACINYFENANEFHHRFWFDASNETTLRQSFALVAGSLTPPLVDQSPSIVLNWIQQRKRRWLIVFDDVAAGDLKIQDYIPRVGNGFILLSAQRSIAFIDMNIPIEDLSTSFASDLLLDMSGLDKLEPDNKAQATILVELLRKHPLAICVAGAFIRKQDETISQYIKEWKECIFEEYGDWNEDPTGQDRSLGKTFKMTLDEISRNRNQENAVTASDLLRLLAFFHQERVSMRIFYEAWKYRVDIRQSDLNHTQLQKTWMDVFEPERSIQWSGFSRALLGGLNLLQDYSLLSLVTDLRNAKTDAHSSQWHTVGVHALVHEWVLRAMTADEQREWFMKAASILAANLSKNEAMSNDLVSHLGHICGKQPIGTIYESQCYLSKDTYFLALRFADIYTREGYFKEAKLVRERVCSKFGESRFPNMVEYVDAIGSQADSCVDLGEHQEAYELRKEAFDITERENLIQKDLDLFVRCTKELAQSAHILGYHDQAFRQRDQLCQLIQSYLGRSNIGWRGYLKMEYITCQRERAISLLEIERGKEAVFELQKIVANQENTLSAADNELLLTRTWLAEAYSRIGQHDQALDQRLKVYTQRKQSNERHPNTLIAQECVAQSFLALGNPENALYIRLEALDQWRDHNAQLPPDYPQRLTTKLNVARSYEIQHKWEDAVRYYDEVYSSKLQSAQLYHPMHCRYQSNGDMQSCPGNQNAFLCGDTHKGYGTGLAIEALEGKSCIQYRLKQQEAASCTRRHVEEIWKRRLSISPQEQPDYFTSMNVLATVIEDNESRINYREKILKEQEADSKAKRIDILKTKLDRRRDLFSQRIYEQAFNMLGDVLGLANMLISSFPQEVNEARSMYEEAHRRLTVPRASSNRATPSQRANRPERH